MLFGQYINSHRIFKQLAMALIRLCVCTIINPDQTTPSCLCLFDQVVMPKNLESGMWIGDIWKVRAFNYVLD